MSGTTIDNLSISELLKRVNTTLTDDLKIASENDLVLLLLDIADTYHDMVKPTHQGVQSGQRCNLNQATATGNSGQWGQLLAIQEMLQTDARYAAILDVVKASNDPAWRTIVHPNLKPISSGTDYEDSVMEILKKKKIGIEGVEKRNVKLASAPIPEYQDGKSYMIDAFNDSTFFNTVVQPKCKEGQQLNSRVCKTDIYAATIGQSWDQAYRFYWKPDPMTIDFNSISKTVGVGVLGQAGTCIQFAPNNNDKYGCVRLLKEGAQSSDDTIDIQYKLIPNLRLSVSALCSCIGDLKSLGPSPMRKTVVDIISKHLTKLGEGNRKRKRDDDVADKIADFIYDDVRKTINFNKLLHIKRSGDYGQLALIKQLNSQPVANPSDKKTRYILTFDRLCYVRAKYENIPAIRIKNNGVIDVYQPSDTTENLDYNQLVNDTLLHIQGKLSALTIANNAHAALQPLSVKFHFESNDDFKWEFFQNPARNQLVDAMEEMHNKLKRAIDQVVVAYKSNLEHQANVIQNTLQRIELTTVQSTYNQLSAQFTSSRQIHPNNDAAMRALYKEVLELNDAVCDIEEKVEMRKNAMTFLNDMAHIAVNNFIQINITQEHPNIASSIDGFVTLQIPVFKAPTEFAFLDNDKIQKLFTTPISKLATTSGVARRIIDTRQRVKNLGVLIENVYTNIIPYTFDEYVPTRGGESDHRANIEFVIEQLEKIASMYLDDSTLVQQVTHGGQQGGGVNVESVDDVAPPCEDETPSLMYYAYQARNILARVNTSMLDEENFDILHEALTHMLFSKYGDEFDDSDAYGSDLISNVMHMLNGQIRFEKYISPDAFFKELVNMEKMTNISYDNFHDLRLLYLWADEIVAWTANQQLHFNIHFNKSHVRIELAPASASSITFDESFTFKALSSRHYIKQYPDAYIRFGILIYFNTFWKERVESASTKRGCENIETRRRCLRRRMPRRNFTVTPYDPMIINVRTNMFANGSSIIDLNHTSNITNMTTTGTKRQGPDSNGDGTFDDLFFGGRNVESYLCESDQLDTNKKIKFNENYNDVRIMAGGMDGCSKPKCRRYIIKTQSFFRGSAYTGLEHTHYYICSTTQRWNIIRHNMAKLMAKRAKARRVTIFT